MAWLSSARMWIMPGSSASSITTPSTGVVISTSSPARLPSRTPGPARSGTAVAAQALAVQAGLAGGTAVATPLIEGKKVDPMEAQTMRKFKKAGLPIIGDDIKSQVGATIMHRSLATLYEDRGVHLERTYQLNVGGNMDFLNMLERERLVR